MMSNTRYAAVLRGVSPGGKRSDVRAWKGPFKTADRAVKAAKGRWESPYDSSFHPIPKSWSYVVDVVEMQPYDFGRHIMEVIEGALKAQVIVDRLLRLNDIMNYFRQPGRRGAKIRMSRYAQQDLDEILRESLQKWATEHLSSIVLYDPGHEPGGLVIFERVVARNSSGNEVDIPLSEDES